MTRHITAPRSARSTLGVVLFGLILAVAGAMVPGPIAAKDGQPTDSESVGSENESQQDNTASRYREGSRIHDRNGRFRVSGDRIEFIPSDGHDPLLVLENLALERVKAEVVRIGSTIRWEVVGMVTEFEGDNFLLLNRASLTTAGPTDEP